ncbi:MULTISPECIES: nucleoside transporter C-terminal domain-containing protein [unclassified Methylobacterium]|uniref:NupC/NupG family nucleoside CNT transporter n=1 Tax=unclassified Methylobacterium TaxID=2615210 RepID=UPI0011C203B1|nr:MULTISPECIES: nucleoside transporter C-terminal domain-containing protein [unclassified Methylobacterium]QEE42358.1 NupC/NupG family nucleoside CNT transporter [Methylobacterium sp. WL1]TXN01476.1 NupC/NupG family nucleoside CNT transporter [Methylobacterium sp. WL64]TXN59697.1 NupC/NupG family nucleoside CNT transporter [Methylobacterium sp. WL2]
MLDRLIHAGLSILLLLAVGALFSTNRRAIRPRIVLSALALQVSFGALVLFLPAGQAALRTAADIVVTGLSYGDRGTAFLFGGLVEPKMFELFGGSGFILALRVLPQILYVSALIGVLYHLGVMQALARGLGAGLRRILGTSPIESFSAVITIAIGQSEIAVALRPFLPLLTGAELFAVMSSGASSTAGSILAGYAALGVPMTYLLAASVMAIPGGLLYAKILMPSTEPTRIATTRVEFGESRAANIIEAAADGTQKGLVVAVSVGAMLIAFVGLIALANGVVGYAGGLAGYPGTSIEGVLGWALAPLAWLLGVPWAHAALVGGAIGQKIAFNEFLAYATLSPTLGAGTLDPRSQAIVCFALCGFANLASIAIQLASFSSLVPERRSEVARYGLRAILAGTLANLTSAAIAGLFVG